MSIKNEKNRQLGLNFSTASHQLKKLILFDLIKKLSLNTCFHCKTQILTDSSLSIEHKVPWLYSKNPKELFFDLDNIAFSHTRCNYIRRRNSSKITNKHGYKGVVYATRSHRKKEWYACIGHKDKILKSIYFKTVQEAAKEYDRLALKYQGKKAVTNKMLGLV